MLIASPDTYNPIFERDHDTWVFDLDNTLYGADCNLFDQIDDKIGRYVQSFLGLGPKEAREVQKQYLLEHGTTLRGLMDNHAVDAKHYLDDVHDIDFTPIQKNDHLRNAINDLDGRKLVFTNASKPYAIEILNRLGISDLFDDVFDILDAEMQPKPNIGVYRKFLKDHDVNPEKSVMFEDMVRNLIPAHGLGMATVWINNGDEWGSADYDKDIVHAETTNLSDWLHQFLVR